MVQSPDLFYFFSDESPFPNALGKGRGWGWLVALRRTVAGVVIEILQTATIPDAIYVSAVSGMQLSQRWVCYPHDALATDGQRKVRPSAGDGGVVEGVVGGVMDTANTIDVGTSNNTVGPNWPHDRKMA